MVLRMRVYGGILGFRCYGYRANILLLKRVSGLFFP